MTTLARAAESGHLEVAKVLIQAGVDVHMQDEVIDFAGCCYMLYLRIHITYGYT